MKNSAQFWREQEWPRDTPELVFAGRAIMQLAPALVGGWTGDEFTFEPLTPIDFATDARRINNILARYLPQSGRTEFYGSMAPPPIGRDGPLPPIFNISAEERTSAIAYIREHNTGAAAASERKRTLQTIIADLAAVGKLATQFRSVRGGGFSPIPTDWWNTEQLEQRFAFCEIDPQDPFGPKGGAFIFFSRSDLGQILAPQQRATISQETTCQKWLEAEFAKGGVRTQEKFRVEAIELFGIGHNAFYRAWRAAAKTAPDMARPGRRPARPVSNGPA